MTKSTQSTLRKKRFKDPGMAYPYSNPGFPNDPYYDYRDMGVRGKDSRLANGGPGRYGVSEEPSLVGRQLSRGVSNFVVEHLASFPQDGKTGFVTPGDALKRLKRISIGAGLWAQVMSMRVTDELVTMANGETMEIIEQYPLEQISQCTHILNDPIFGNLLIFITKLSRDKVGAVHLFQCRSGEAPVISNDINRRLMIEPEEPHNGYHHPNIPEPQPVYHPPAQEYRGHDRDVGSPTPTQESPRDAPRKRIHEVPREVKPPAPSYVEPPKPAAAPVQREPVQREPVYREPIQREPVQREPVVEERRDSHESAQRPITRQMTQNVRKTVQDIEKSPEFTVVQPNMTEASVKRQPSTKQVDYPENTRTPVEDARINRDVEILNHCIEEIENFVIQLKQANDARKALAVKKKKKGKKFEMLQLQAQAPPDSRITDIYQKFKFSFNLLGRLRPHISSPNSPELVHYLMVPLHIIGKVTGMEKARDVTNPLLTASAVDLLGNCLASREHEFWTSLGPNWTLTKSSSHFRDKYIPPYQPIFADGWVPPEIVTNEREDAAARSAAAMVARIKKAEEEQRLRELNDNLQFRQENPPKAQQQQQDQPKLTKQAVVVYDYTAHNNKELTIRSGEKVAVLDDSRRWWLVKNAHLETGYVPSTVLEFPAEDSSDSSSFDGSAGPPSPPSTGFNTAVQAVNNNNNEILYTKPQKSSLIERETRYENIHQPASPVYKVQEQVVTRPSPERKRSDQTPVPSFVPPTPPAPPTPTVVVPPPPPPAQFSTVVPPPPPPPEDIPVFVVPPPPAPKPSAKPAPRPASKPENLQSELRNRLNSTSNSLAAPTSYPAAVDIDGVEVFIPLYKSSTADDVSRWLRKLRFSDDTVSALHGVTAKELFKLPRDDLVEKVGEVEGGRLYEELLVQTGAHTKHKTMTEFQKVLMQRMRTREDSEKEDLQKKYDEQQELIRKQQEELQRLKGREPDKPTFSSFNGPSGSNSFNFASQSVQGKTKF